MIDTSRNYILTLFEFFEQSPGSKERWVEDSPFRRNVIQKANKKHSLDTDSIAAQLIFSIFLERRVSEPIPVYDKYKDLIRDLKDSNASAFLCELTANRLPVHHFIIQKTADSLFYIYQSHAPFYTLEESIKGFNKEPISLEDLSSRLSLLGGSILTQSYGDRLFKNLFHIPYEAPPVSLLSLNYFKCPYHPTEPLPHPRTRYKLAFSPLRLTISLAFLTFIYFAIQYFRQMDHRDYILEVKYNPPRQRLFQ
ncbi:MAG: hypothetical protein ACK4HV_09025 [Parachlamydiaceae bacterium]